MTVSASTVALCVSLYAVATSGCSGTSPQTAEALRDALRSAAKPIVEELIRQAIPLPKEEAKPDTE
jgi:hypothetical protein